MKYLIFILFLFIFVHAKPQNSFSINQLDDDCKDPKDQGTDCETWARNGFCTNCHYTCAQRRNYCEKTCGFCSPDYVCNETCPPNSTTISPLVTDKEIQMLNQ